MFETLGKIFFLLALVASPHAPAKEKKNHYDVVILGAGPGGLSAAVMAANIGAKVLVLEKRNLPQEGEDNTTAYGSRSRILTVSNKAIGLLENNGVTGTPLAPYAGAVRFHGWSDNKIAKRFLPNSKVFQFLIDRFSPLELGATVGLNDLEKSILNRAQELGVTVNFGATTQDVYQDKKRVHLLVNNKKISADYLISAEGANSTTFKELNHDRVTMAPPAGKNIALANFKNTGETPGELRARNLHTGQRKYLLTFIHNDYLTIYAMLNTSEELSMTESKKKSFMLQAAEDLEINGKMLGEVVTFSPTTDRLETFHIGQRILIIGDQAHRVDPVSGGGTAKAVLEALRTQDFLNTALFTTNKQITKEALEKFNTEMLRAAVANGDALKKYIQKRHTSWNSPASFIGTTLGESILSLFPTSKEQFCHDLFN